MTRWEGRAALDAGVRGPVPVRMFPEARTWWPWTLRNVLVRGLSIPHGDAMGWILDVRHAVSERLAGLAGGAEW